MVRENLTQSKSNAEYFAALEQTWSDQARKKKLSNRLVVVQREEDNSDPYASQYAPQYDVLHIDGQGKAHRVGGFSDFDTIAISTATNIERSGIEGIKLLRDEGFQALYDKASKPVRTDIANLRPPSQ